MQKDEKKKPYMIEFVSIDQSNLSFCVLKMQQTYVYKSEDTFSTL